MLIGLAVALLGVFLTHQLDASVLDAVASVVIAGILVVTALGSPKRAGACWWARRQTPRWSPTSAASSWRSEDVLLNIEVTFTPGLTAKEIHEVVHRIERRIEKPHPAVRRIFIEVEALAAGRDGKAAHTAPLQASEARGACAEHQD